MQQGNQKIATNTGHNPIFVFARDERVLCVGTAGLCWKQQACITQWEGAGVIRGKTRHKAMAFAEKVAKEALQSIEEFVAGAHLAKVAPQSDRVVPVRQAESARGKSVQAGAAPA